MNRLISFPHAPKESDLTETTSPQRRGHYVMLVASVVLVLFLGTIIAANLQPKNLPVPAVPAPAVSATPVPTSLPSSAVSQQTGLVDAMAYRAVWSPNGEVLALATSKGVWIYDANDLTLPLYNIYPGLAVVSPIVFSQDSTRFAFASGQGIRLWDLTKQEKTEIDVPHEGIDTVFALNSDGTLLASAHRQGLIYFHNVDTNTTLWGTSSLTQTFQPIHDMRFNGAGTKLTYIGADSVMGADTPFFTLEDPTGTWKTFYKEPTMFSPSVLSDRLVQSIGYSHDGSRLSARVDSLIVVWDTATNTEVKRFDTGVPPDEAHLMEMALWQQDDLLSLKSGTGDMTFSADSSQMVTVDTSVRIWDVSSGKVQRVIEPLIPDFDAATSTIAIKSDWTQMSIVDGSGTVFIVDMATGQEITRIRDTQNAVTGGSGLQFEYGGQVTSVDSEVAIDAMQEAGMTWIKIDKHYTGTLSSNAAEEIAAAQANGFKVLISAMGSPKTLTQRGNDYLDSYSKWLGELAAAGADAIEVWKEPNLSRRWPQGQIGGSRYADMLRAAYLAIKSANNETLVISAAPAPTGAEAAFPGMVQNDYNWLQELVNAGGLGYLDCVGIHYNEGILPPDATSGDPRDSYHTRYFTSMMDTYMGVIDNKKPLCFTEIGYLSPEGLGSPLPEMFAWAEDVTVAEQAAWLAQAATMASESGKVRLMIVWNIDFTKNSGNYPDAGFAIVRPDGDCPACDALAELR